MKILVKDLEGSHFEIQVNPQDTVSEVKQNVETIKGSDVYPASQQMLIYREKVLEDNTTVEENEVAENNVLLVMLMKTKSSSGEGSFTATVPSTTISSPPASSSASAAPVSGATTGTQITSLTTLESAPSPVPAPAPDPTLAATGSAKTADAYDLAASNLVSGTNLEETIQQILVIGGWRWDRETVVRALGAAFNNPERAIDYLYSGIPEQGEQATSTATAHSLAAAVSHAKNLTHEELLAVSRLEAMGFDQTLVLEVFFACDKNEELAANILLDQRHQ